MKDLIDRDKTIEALLKEGLITAAVYVVKQPSVQKILHPKMLKNITEQLEPLTYDEQIIFLAGMDREEKVCKEVPYNTDLVRLCREVKRKVKKALWTN